MTLKILFNLSISILLFSSVDAQEIIDISTLVGSQSIQIFGNEKDSPGFDPDDGLTGYSSAIGDIDGDGYMDFIIGSPAGVPTKDNNDGYVSVIYGNDGVLESNIHMNTFSNDQGAWFTSTNRNQESGREVVTGDLNGDGYMDVIIGAHFESRVFIVYGSNERFKQDVALGKNIIQGYGRFGSTLTTGDFNGDGFSDILVGAPSTDKFGNNSGSVYIIYGKENLNEINSIDIQNNDYNFVRVTHGNNENNWLGNSIVSGDVNGNNIDDIVINSFKDDELIYSKVIFGTTDYLENNFAETELNGANGFEIANNKDAAYVRYITDINNDGRKDLILEANNDEIDEWENRSTQRNLFILNGKQNFNEFILLDSLEQEEGYWVSFDRYDTNIGFSAFTNCDINSDGLNDLIFSSEGWDFDTRGEYRFRAGAVYIMFGYQGLKEDTVNFETLSENQAFTLIGGERDDLGFSLSCADVNKDSFSDLLIGALGNEKLYSFSSVITVPNENEEYLRPVSFRLKQNYPNPFNPSTVIEFDISQTSKIKLEIFDLLGKKIETLIENETKSPGSYSVTYNSKNLSSGIYIYRIFIDDKILSKKMTLIK